MTPKSKTVTSRAPRARSADRRERLGVWLFGGLGGLSTTVVAGAAAVVRKLAPPRGLLSETALTAGLGLTKLEDLVFGGHDIRLGDPLAAAREIGATNGSLPLSWLDAIAPDLRAYGKRLRVGTTTNAGRTIRALADVEEATREVSIEESRERIVADIREFMRREKLTRCVCVNLCSTEPKLPPHKDHADPAGIERIFARNEQKKVRPSTIYAAAAAELGLPFVHFTPSDATLLPGVQQSFVERGVPFAGCDGKTGETLVKTALAPLFRYRDLNVLSWLGYNMLGDRDGVVLADAENKASKVESKDKVLERVLGYAAHSRVGIDYVPSLGDQKTAWDFIHFEGFLGYRMSLQFTWQGCDAILAAPLVLDLVRLCDLAHRGGEVGALGDLAIFFKQPIGSSVHNLHEQWLMLERWIAQHRTEH